MNVLGLIFSIGAVTFSCAIPTILKDKCKHPTKVEHAELDWSKGDWNKQAYSQGVLAYYICRPGYMRLGTIRKICSEGEWVRISNGSCKRKRCNNPGEIDFGTFELINEEDFLFGAIVEYSCQPGYQMISKHKRIECTVFGWSKEPPECEARLCPPVVDDSVRILSTVLDEEYTHGQVINLQCKNPNDKLNGPSQIYCTTNGTWNIEPPTCKDYSEEGGMAVKQSHGDKLIPITVELPQVEQKEQKLTETKCAPPPLILFAELIGERKWMYDSGSVIQYQCLMYYKVKGNQQIKCQDGVWDLPPTCLRPCVLNYYYMKGNNTTVENGRSKFLEHDEVVHFKCLPTFEISKPGQLNAKCLDGTLQYPKCVKIKQKRTEKKCSPPPFILFGELMGEKKWMYDSGSVIQYQCLMYYKLKGNQQIKCQDGVWDLPPTCLRPCVFNYNYMKGNNTTVENVRSKFVEHDDAVHFKCLPTFEISKPGQLNAKCLDGTLQYPKCVKIKQKKMCPPPPEILFGELAGEKKQVYNKGSVIQYQCFQNFKLLGKQKIKCRNGVWDIPPICLRPCVLNYDYMKGNNTTVENGRSMYLEHGEFVHFKCLNTFETSKPKQLNAKCLDGTLKYPKCVKMPDEVTAQPSVGTETTVY
ncbi:coagulation factor XIII B chain-like isoform X2 [Pyxicephalus adspersus]|uniref:coagulation factor XIII B chain-like isoform X2 n=1 Tax=Pyxicephalus adspersus TaxID=30357 RepID=UPI003B5BD796